MRILPLLALALLAGCASVDATRRLAAAEVAMEGARASGAEKRAPYEYVLATAYYQKAREENGRGRYGDAAEHAAAAARWAAQAKAKATEAVSPPEAR